MSYSLAGNSHVKDSTVHFYMYPKLSKEQKQNFPLHLTSLVSTYNAMPHSTTWFQPYELMFGCKAQTVCDVLANCNDQYSQSKCV